MAQVIPDNVKRAGTVQNITKEQAAEYLKCKDDPDYFIETYVKITDIDVGTIPFKMRSYQKTMIHHYHKHRFNINLLSRQSGKTTAVAAYGIYHVLFSDRKHVKILANKYENARGILDRIKKSYELLPEWLQQGVLKWNEGSIELENYSQISVGTTTPDSGRSASISLLILDEFAFVKNNIASEFWSAVYPVISSGKKTRVIIISTANGLNLFYKLYTDAKKGMNSFVPFEVSWTDVPGRDEKWRKETIANLNNDEDLFRQEYENDFIGNSNTLIPISVLKTLVFTDPIETKESFSIFEYPTKGRIYFITVDCARGVGNDFSSMQVLDITEYPYKQVAVYRNNRIDPIVYPTIIVQWAERYNNAYVLLEANDVGESIGDMIHMDLEYENLLLVSHQGRAGQRLGGGFSKAVRSGVMTSKRTKNIGMTSMKAMITSHQLVIQDFLTIEELSTFSKKGDSYEAEEGAYDDLVMPLVVFGWAAQEAYFKDLMDQDLRVRIEGARQSELMETVPAFGFIDNGLNDDGWEDVEPGPYWNWD